MISQLQMKQVSSFSQQWQHHLDSNITAPPIARRLLPFMIASSNNCLSQGFACLRQYYHQEVIKIEETILIIVKNLKQRIKIILACWLCAFQATRWLLTKGLFLQLFGILVCSVSKRMLQKAFYKILYVLRARELLLLLLRIWRYEIVKYCFWKEVLQFCKSISLFFNFPFVVWNLIDEFK